ncbi:MAG: flagellar export protein FliJ [Aquabacterium sp.]|jgi:flagellar FliJ protein|uniref:flagellar export protein FliJ n=1 Tax=Aquabacterium sp. TaxID=1872578 RepID=UPI001B73C8D6|nr:flagellar export protein FliJ [Aquabacterium sp.]MBP7132114.1 flagellar export protein FliJ [Aquabacterium sp.]MBP9062433.1 flagellar export protein FliJ [Aquabacterium sp.]MDQ5927441.1 flagellar protein FliJ [Pseudomonadota bacterium]
MSATQSLLIILEAAEKARDQAVAAHEARRKTYEAARQQAQSLTDWRRDYQNRWQAQFRQSGGVEIVRCYQDFMQRLGDAVGAQDLQVAQAQALMEHSRLELVERERRVAAVSKLIDKRLLEARVRHARQDQKATDEMASRAAHLAASLPGGINPMASTTL